MHTCTTPDYKWQAPTEGCAGVCSPPQTEEVANIQHQAPPTKLVSKALATPRREEIVQSCATMVCWFCFQTGWWFHQPPPSWCSGTGRGSNLNNTAILRCNLASSLDKPLAGFCVFVLNSSRNNQVRIQQYMFSCCKMNKVQSPLLPNYA